METQATRHDATTGFHDIANVRFYQAVPNYGLLLGLLAAAIALLLVYKLWKQSGGKKQTPAIPILDACLEKIAALRRSEQPGKTELIELSLTTRRYLSEELLAHCQEMTIPELTACLRQLFAKRAPRLRASELDSFTAELLALLGDFEHKLFAPNATLETSYFQDACDKARELLKRIASSLSRHDQENVTIISQSKLQP